MQSGAVVGNSGGAAINGFQLERELAVANVHAIHLIGTSGSLTR